MEFKSLKNIETSFRQIRLFGIVFLCLCALVSVFSVVASFRFAEKQREKIYVLDGGKSLMLALSQDLSQNRPVEAREHIRRFHELFFTLSPDKRIIVILTLLLFFSVLSLYFTVSSIYRFGKGAGERMQIRHIERLELELRQRQEADSVKHLKDFNYDDERKTE